MDPVEEKVVRVLSIDIGIVNLALCITEFSMENHEFELIHVEKTSIGTMKQTCQVLSAALLDFFRTSVVINEKPFDHIFIENQVSRAIKNTILGYTCYSYFYTLSNAKGDGSQVNFISPRNKFKAIEAYLPGTLDKYDVDHIKAPSAHLKKLSVQIAKDVFDDLNVTKGIEAMENFKKKDDVSDVFLQSFSLFLDQNKGSENPLRLKKRRKTK